MILTIVSTIIGFLAPLLPEGLKLFRERQDNKHELDLMKLRMTASEKEHLWKIEELASTADIEEAKVIHKPQVSFGVQLLDAAKQSGFGKWALVPAFYLFILLDFITGMVRPLVAYIAFVFYMVYRWQCAILLKSTTLDMSFGESFAKVWGDNDWAVLFMVLAFYFGDRTRKHVFNAGTR